MWSACAGRQDGGMGTILAYEGTHHTDGHRACLQHYQLGTRMCVTAGATAATLGPERAYHISHFEMHV